MSAARYLRQSGDPAFDLGVYCHRRGQVSFTVDGAPFSISVRLEPNTAEQFARALLEMTAVARGEVPAIPEVSA